MHIVKKGDMLKPLLSKLHYLIFFCNKLPQENDLSIESEEWDDFQQVYVLEALPFFEYQRTK